MHTLNKFFTRLGLALAGVALMSAPAWSIDYYLQAEQFLKTMPDGSSVVMWGYAQYSDQTFTTQVRAASAPGPVLDVPAGDSTGLTIYLRNNLPALTNVPVETSLVIPGQLEAGMTPTLFPADALGRQRVKSFTHETARGSVGTYRWPTLKPGTYLYHSGTHVQVQVQMGLYGAVTRDATTVPREAYPGRAYDNQVTLVFSEIDPALHQAISNGTYGVPSPPGTPNPNPTSTINYLPKHFLINGASYSSASSVPIPAGEQAGQRVLLRLLNAGLESHVPSILGSHFQLVAEDGSPLPYTREQHAPLLAAGKTMDAIWVPPAAGIYPVYDGRLRQGMLVQLAVTGNGPPTITSTPVLTAAVDVPYSYQVTATDPNAGDVLTYSLTTAPAGMIISATGLISWTPAATQVGPQAVLVRVQDEGGLFTTQTFTIAVNGPPVITSTAITSATVGVAYSYQVTATDPNAGDVLTYSLTTAPEGMTISATGLISWTPTATQTGPQAVTARVQDQGGLFATQTFTVTVAANLTPAITSAPILTATAGTAYSYQVVGTDPNAGDTLTYSLTTAPVGMTIGAAGLIAWTPTATQTGPQAVTVRVQDQGGLFATQSFTIAVNGAPVITSAAVTTATTGVAYSYQVVGTDPNVGDTLTYSLTTAPVGMTIGATGLIAWTPTATQTGPQAVTVRVQDQGGLFVTQSFTVTVAAAGPAVVSITLRNATVQGDPILVQPLVNGATLNLAALCNNCQVNFQAVTSPATIAGGSVRLVLTGATAQARNDNTNPYTLPANPGGNYAGITLNPGSHTLTATPYSGTNATGTPGTPLTITFTVGAANVAPTITSTAITTAVVSYAYSYQVVATDPNPGTTLTYSLTAAPAGMTIGATGLVSWTPTAAQVSPPQPLVTVRVQDQGGLFATQSFNIAVAANQAPAITSTIPPTTAGVGTAYSYQVTATDPNPGSLLTYSLTTAPAGMTIGATGLVSWTPTVAQTGPQAVTVRVQDQGGLFVTQAFTVTVAGTPPPLPAGLVAAYAFNEGAGTTVADATGLGHTGTLVGATWTPSGRYGAGLVFNGTNARVTVPDAADLDLTTGVTLEAWVYPTAAGGGAWRTVITKDTAASGNYLLYANTDTNNAGMFVGSTFQQQVVGGPTLTANSWTHLTGTYDGITIRLYVNGVQVASRAQTQPMATNNALLSIGGSGVWGEWFAGRLDELRIYNRALTAAEIQADSAAPLP